MATGAVIIQLNDRDQRFVGFLAGEEIGSLDYSLVNGVVDLHMVRMKDGFDTGEYCDQFVTAVINYLEHEEDLHIRPTDPIVMRWVADHPDYFDLVC